MNELADRRRQKQPLEYASAGSTFKRPEGNFAGKLIMDAGLRGLRIGGARVSDKHCGFIINDGTATAADVAELIEEVSERVKEKFGVSLEPEGHFSRRLLRNNGGMTGEIRSSYGNERQRKRVRR